MAPHSVSPSHPPRAPAVPQVLAWGANERGQLGLGDTLDRHTPTAVEGLWGLPVMRLAAGDSHSMALTTTGQLFTWGSNSHGQCGVVIEPPGPPPQPPQPDEQATPLASPAAAAAAPPPQQQAGGRAEQARGDSRLGPPPDMNPQLLEAWRGAMGAMGIAPDLTDLSLHQTNWRGVEVRLQLGALGAGFAVLFREGGVLFSRGRARKSRVAFPVAPRSWRWSGSSPRTRATWRAFSSAGRRPRPRRRRRRRRLRRRRRRRCPSWRGRSSRRITAAPAARSAAA